MDLRIEPRAARQGRHIPEKILILPVEVPVADRKQRLHLATGKRCGQLHLRGEVVGVRADTGRVDIDRQRKGIANHEIFLARRNVEPGEKRIHRRQLNRNQTAAGRLFGEVQTDHRSFHFWFSRGVEMILNHKIRALRETQRQTFRKEMRLRADRPSAQRQRSAARPHAAEARFCALILFQMDAAVGIGKVQDMMHCRACRGAHFDCCDPLVFAETER